MPRTRSHQHLMPRHGRANTASAPRHCSRTQSLCPPAQSTHAPAVVAAACGRCCAVCGAALFAVPRVVIPPHAHPQRRDACGTGTGTGTHRRAAGTHTWESASKQGERHEGACRLQDTHKTPTPMPRYPATAGPTATQRTCAPCNGNCHGWWHALPATPASVNGKPHGVACVCGAVVQRTLQRSSMPAWLRVHVCAHLQ